MKPIEKEFCQGVKILLERMKNNPEDFKTDIQLGMTKPKFYKFASLMHDLILGRNKERTSAWVDWSMLTKQEQAALMEGFKDMRRQGFSNEVMRMSLADPEVERNEYEVGNTYSTQTAKQIMRISPQMVQAANTLGISPAEYAQIANKLGAL